MSDFKDKMTTLFKGDSGESALYVLLIGMAMGNLLPTPSDALYMKLQAGLRDKWKKGEITATQYWEKNVWYYYSVPFLYWGALALVVINIKTSYQNKLKVAGALVGAGVALGIILKLLANDKEQLAKEDEERDLLLKNHPEIVDILKKPEYENIAGQIVGAKNKEDISGVNGERKYVKLYREREAERNGLDL